MKSLSLKVLGCAAVMVLLTSSRAQTYDEGQGQMAPQPNNGATDNNGNGAEQDQNGPAQNGSTQPGQPNVVYVPVVPAADLQNSNFQVMPPDQGQQQPPAQGGTPNPNQTFRVLPPMGGTQNQNRYERRSRWDRRGGEMSQRQSANTDPSAYVPPANASTNGTEGIMLNFHGAPIDEVLNYLSDAAGFIIQLDTRVSGTIDVWSAHPVTKDEAVQILNSVLNRQGYAAVRSGTRTLRIMSHDDALHSMIPVVQGSDPNAIPDSDEMVTQIIPIRNVQARQLITDLSPLISSGATIMANDAGNSIIVTDTQANIKHLAQIIQAIDGSAEDVTEVRVFHLQYHDPVEVATMLTSVFADQSQGGNAGPATPIRFGGFPGFGGGGFRRFFGGGGGGGGFGRGGGGGQGFGANQAAGGGGQSNVRPHAHVVAVADQRTQSVLVTAPKDLMSEIDELVAQVDQESPKVQRVSVIHLENADPTEVQKVLQQFQANNGRSSQSQQNSVLMQRANQNSSSSSVGGFGGGSGIGSGFGGGNGGGFGGGNGGGFGGGFRGGGQ